MAVPRRWPRGSEKQLVVSRIDRFQVLDVDEHHDRASHANLCGRFLQAKIPWFNWVFLHDAADGDSVSKTGC